MSDNNPPTLYREATVEEMIDDFFDGVLWTLPVVPVESVGMMDVHENGTKAINFYAEPGRYVIVRKGGVR